MQMGFEEIVQILDGNVAPHSTERLSVFTKIMSLLTAAPSLPKRSPLNNDGTMAGGLKEAQANLTTTRLLTPKPLASSPLPSLRKDKVHIYAPRCGMFNSFLESSERNEMTFSLNLMALHTHTH